MEKGYDAVLTDIQVLTQLVQQHGVKSWQAQDLRAYVDSWKRGNRQLHADEYPEMYNAIKDAAIVLGISL